MSLAAASNPSQRRPSNGHTKSTVDPSSRVFPALFAWLEDSIIMQKPIKISTGLNAPIMLRISGRSATLGVWIVARYPRLLLSFC
jgi:hypothetical protein